MVTTRSKARTEDGGNDVPQQPLSKASTSSQQKKSKNANTSRKRKEPASSAAPPAANQGKKRKDSVAEQQDKLDHSRAKDDEQEGKPKDEGTGSKPHSSKLDNLLDKYGSLPLHDAGLESPSSPTSATILAHIINALLSSARISHEVAARTVQLLIREGYHDLATLMATTWQQRTEVLTEGGYTHYREKTATELGDLAALLAEQYGGDASALLPSEDEKVAAGEAARKELRSRLKAIKGFGDVGADIFIAAVQSVFPRVAPFLDRRSRDTAEQIGLGKDVEALFEELEGDAVKIAKLNSALTRVRLEKRIGEFK